MDATSEGQEQQQQQQQQPEQTWREESGSKQNPEAERHRRAIIRQTGAIYSKYSMNAKANMLSDLLSRFKPSTGDHHGDCCEGRIKDRFNFVKRKDRKERKQDRGFKFTFSKKRNAQKSKLAINNLISQMQSPSFGIQPDPSEFDINRGIVTFSFYDKTPREPLPQVDISAESSPESRPEVTKKFENCSIDSDSHRISGIMDIHQQ